MLAPQVCCLALLLHSPVPGTITEPAASAAVGGIFFEERTWGRGSSPSLTFTVSAGRGPLEKVAAFLYFSEEPGAFLTSPFPPQFVGLLAAPASVSLTVYAPPERGPINEFTREKFVQGALFDVRTGALVNVTNEDYLDVEYEAPPVTYALDFETEDDFATPLVNGQDLSTPPEFGQLVSISSRQRPTGGAHFGPAIFDSDPAGPNAGPRDPDLLVGLGNIVVLQEIANQTVPGIFDYPDDTANGGVLVFDFAAFGLLQKVEPRSLDLIDVDASSMTVTLIDVLGHDRTYTVPSGWTEDVFADGPPGYRTLDLASLLPQAGFASTATAASDTSFLPDEVARIEIMLHGSGAIDNLVFAREQDSGVTAAPATKDTRARAKGPPRRP
jgi:hypothetical protein